MTGNVSFLSSSSPTKDTRDLWATVSKIIDICPGNHCCPGVLDITADELNKHYADVSTDHIYEHPLSKATVCMYLFIYLMIPKHS